VLGRRLPRIVGRVEPIVCACVSAFVLIGFRPLDSLLHP